jgi:hypothetical protein
LHRIAASLVLPLPGAGETSSRRQIVTITPTNQRVTLLIWNFARFVLIPRIGAKRTRAAVGHGAQLVVAHDEIAQPIGAVGNRVGRVPTIGTAQAIHDVQVGPGDGDFSPLTAEGLEELLQGRHPLRQTFFCFETLLFDIMTYYVLITEVLSVSYNSNIGKIEIALWPTRSTLSTPP